MTHPPPASAPPADFDREQSYQHYLASLLDGDRQKCRAHFEQWLAATPDLRRVYEDLVQRSLYEVGERWAGGHISVATEHLSTAISEGLLNLTYPRLFARPRVNKTALVTCSANEYHQIGGKMVADFFELYGWRGYFLGAGTPLADVKTLIEAKHPDVVALSVAVEMNLPQLLAAVGELRAAFPAVPILVGGQGLRWGGRERLERVARVRYLASLVELEKWIQQASDDA